MKGFGDFKRIAVIVIPDDEEYKKRVTARKNEWSSKDLADAAVNEMKGIFLLLPITQKKTHITVFSVQ